MKDQARAKARQLAQDFLQRDDRTGWFELLYADAEENEEHIPWGDMMSNPGLVDWLEQKNMQGNGRRALVVGCGLGDDAEELSRRGFSVLAFDIAPSAVAWCKQRFPTSSVEYVVADVLQTPVEWQHSFDFIFEAYTLQVLPPGLRAKAMANIANLLGADGTLLVICRGRAPEDHPGLMPWPLTRDELNTFLATGLHQIQFEDYQDQEQPPTRRFRIQYTRHSDQHTEAPL
ncbi:methyltransferase type 12 [Dictyobacter vulcani]|uniref:Methyltransferase type 12 n=1 Tax=Dictyobacter vulcani TaxID=2607529 RepID=A0A5J4KUI3_9CHLR|nr:class I SAM-dependent methyltransferase [Dictyobacter vulcani]GER90117.1 methyltransferase type 12 [Dictyobacter vulcani]